MGDDRVFLQHFWNPRFLCPDAGKGCALDFSASNERIRKSDVFNLRRPASILRCTVSVAKQPVADSAGGTERLVLGKYSVYFFHGTLLYIASGRAPDPDLHSLCGLVRRMGKGAGHTCTDNSGRAASIETIRLPHSAVSLPTGGNASYYPKRVVKRCIDRNG